MTRDVPTSARSVSNILCRRRTSRSGHRAKHGTWRSLRSLQWRQGAYRSNKLDSASLALRNAWIISKSVPSLSTEIGNGCCSALASCKEKVPIMNPSWSRILIWNRQIERQWSRISNEWLTRLWLTRGFDWLHCHFIDAHRYQHLQIQRRSKRKLIATFESSDHECSQEIESSTNYHGDLRTSSWA